MPRNDATEARAHARPRHHPDPARAPSRLAEGQRPGIDEDQQRTPERHLRNTRPGASGWPIILLLGQDVQIIELPFPKGKVYPQESWEHIEVVIPFLAEESCEQWVERIKNRFQWNQSESLCVKVDEPRADGERLRNPSIAVSFAHSDNHQVCIKVHPYNIKKIIEV